MSNKTQLSEEVIQSIEEAANDYVEETRGRQGRVETYIAGATEYATKFHEAQQENERLKAKLSTYHGIKERCDKMEAALKQFISYHETGLLPDIFTYKKAVETLKQGGSNTPASVQGEKEVDNEQ